VRCDPNLVLLNNSCQAKIPGCVRYLNATACAECDPAVFLLSNSRCVLLSSCSDVQQANLTLYQLAAFGDYMQIPLSQLSEDSGFMRCDRMLRTGEYQHFITASPQPVYFAAYS
jgi:hypothetical protein